MLGQLVDKQRRAVAVVKEAMKAQGLPDCSVCVTVHNWGAISGNYQNCAVFIQSLGNEEPSYETGVSVVEAVKKTLIILKGRYLVRDGATMDESTEAPF
jgi:hypothetical protein